MSHSKHRPGSDLEIDAAKLSLDDLLELRLKLDNLLLPYKFDLIEFSRITEPTLRDHIERVGVLLFERGK